MKYSDSMARLFLTALSCFIMLSQYCHAEDNSFVAIDVGHYKMKPGVISARGIPEFEFNKALANVIVNRFMSEKVTTKLIGNDDLAISLGERTSIAKAIGSTFFLSIHHDSIQPQYLETW